MERFWNKVDKRGSEECWNWHAAKNSAGYGNFWFDGGFKLAHRVAYRLENKENPGGMCVCHSCDNPACVNPNHLWLGSHKENMEDMSHKSRHNAPDPPNSSGENHPNSKLSNKEVKEIRRKYEETKVTQYDLANEYSVSQTTIGEIVRGEKYTDTFS